MSQPILGYWKFRGYGQAIRLLLAHCGVDFVDKFYECGPPPDFSWSEWTDAKNNLELDFPNLPYYIDGDVRISQSIAILRYIGRKYKLDGLNEVQKQRIELIEQQICDYRQFRFDLGYKTTPENFEAAFDKYFHDFEERLEAISKFLGHRKFFGGDHISYVDFFVYEFIVSHVLFKKDLLQPSTLNNLKEFQNRIEALPNVKKYMSSDRFIKWPLFNGNSKFGGKYNKRPEHAF